MLTTYLSLVFYIYLISSHLFAAARTHAVSGERGVATHSWGGILQGWSITFIYIYVFSQIPFSRLNLFQAANPLFSLMSSSSFNSTTASYESLLRLHPSSCGLPPQTRYKKPEKRNSGLDSPRKAESHSRWRGGGTIPEWLVGGPNHRSTEFVCPCALGRMETPY